MSFVGWVGAMFGQNLVFPLLTTDHCDETIDNDHFFFDVPDYLIIPVNTVEYYKRLDGEVSKPA